MLPPPPHKLGKNKRRGQIAHLICHLTLSQPEYSILYRVGVASFSSYFTASILQVEKKISGPPTMVSVLRKLNHHHHSNSKLAHLHHQSPESSPISAFRMELSTGLNGLLSFLDSSNPSMISFSWLDRGFKLMQGMNRAFAKLVEKDLGLPMSKWERPVVDEYLSYTLELLDAFNSISSSLSQLQGSHLALAHALSLILNNGSPSSSSKQLVQPILFDHHQHPTRKSMNGGGVVVRVKINMVGQGAVGFEGRVVLQAVSEMKAFASLLCGVVISSLGGDGKGYLELVRKPSWVQLHSSVLGEMLENHGGVVLKEVKELNDALAALSAPLPAAGVRVTGENELEVLKRRLEGFAKQLAAAEKEVESLFSEIMGSRNQLLGCLRLPK